MNYKHSWKPTPGLSEIVKPGDAGLEQTYFGILCLSAGESYTADAEAKETALVVLSGTCHVRSGDAAFEGIGGRPDVFSGKAATVYVPGGNGYTIEAVSDVEVAVCRASAERP